MGHIAAMAPQEEATQQNTGHRRPSVCTVLILCREEEQFRQRRRIAPAQAECTLRICCRTMYMIDTRWDRRRRCRLAVVTLAWPWHLAHRLQVTDHCSVALRPCTMFMPAPAMAAPCHRRMATA